MWTAFEREDLRAARRVVVNPWTGCWEFMGYVSPAGYGIMGRQGRMYRAHRYVYELLVGPIPGDLQLDHLCRVRHCVNPAHLEPVTLQENVRRGDRWTMEHPNLSKTHCPQGHPYDGENLLLQDGRRRCRAGRRASQKARDARRYARRRSGL